MLTEEFASDPRIALYHMAALTDEHSYEDTLHISLVTCHRFGCSNVGQGTT